VEKPGMVFGGNSVFLGSGVGFDPRYVGDSFGCAGVS
jgi:hypothetical protein